MTETTDPPGEVREALALVPHALYYRGPRAGRGAREINRARRIEALRMRMNGKSVREIAEHLGVSSSRVHQIIKELLAEAENTVANEMRAIENERLDIAQSAIWDKVENGNLQAVDTFIRLSKRRADMNGLDAPAKVVIAADVRVEMEDALRGLEEVVAEAVVVDAEVVDEPGAS